MFFFLEGDRQENPLNMGGSNLKKDKRHKSGDLSELSDLGIAFHLNHHYNLQNWRFAFYIVDFIPELLWRSLLFSEGLQTQVPTRKTRCVDSHGHWKSGFKGSGDVICIILTSKSRRRKLGVEKLPFAGIAYGSFSRLPLSLLRRGREGHYLLSRFFNPGIGVNSS